MIAGPRHFHLHKSPSSPYVLPVPPRRLCVGAGALSPEKGGALRKQSTQGRRLGVATVLCGGVLGAPLLLLHTDRRTRHAWRPRAARRGARAPRRHDAVRRGVAVTVGAVRVEPHDRRRRTTTPTTVPPTPTRRRRRPRRPPRRRRPVTGRSRAPRRRPTVDAGDHDGSARARRRQPTQSTARPRGTPRHRRECAPARRFRSGPS